MDEKTGHEFRIPEYEYFDMGGNYSGSKRGTKQDDFSFRITPAEQINLQIWYDIRCIDLSEIKAEADFEKSREGYLSMCDRIEEEYRLWLKNHSVKPAALGYFSDEE